jgi:DNA-binding Xre family transcriptional regulator
MDTNINQLCELLDCQPGDIMEYATDEEEMGK